MHYEILDEKRQTLLPLFTFFKDRFYLAGGTGLALQIGHRDSIDFDFFSENSFDTSEFFSEFEHRFSGHTILKIQQENNTLGLLVDDTVKISFIAYNPALLEPVVEEPYFRVASVLDIAAMKLSAITGRATQKDYIDLFCILKVISLETVLDAAKKKLPSLDTNLILKSIVYFDDVSEEPLCMTAGNDFDWAEVQNKLEQTVKQYVR